MIVCEEGEEADRGSGEVWKRNRRHKKRHCKCEKMGVHSTTELLTIAGMHSTHSCSCAAKTWVAGTGTAVSIDTTKGVFMWV